MSELIESDELRRNLVERQVAALTAGERLDGSIGRDVSGERPSDEQINERYERGEIRIVTEQGRYPLASISGMLAGKNYKLDPEYQRRHRWSIQQKSRLIESFIMNVPVPPIFLYEWDYNEYEVMDGLQRMSAVREFYENKFALEGLEYWQELDGKTHDELPSRIRAGIDRRYISSIILLKETAHGEDDPEQLKRFVFGRINTGGVQLAPQELRNALYDGPMNRLCKSLSSDLRLRRMWGIPVNVEALIEQTDLVESDSGEEMLDFEITAAGEQTLVPEAYRRMTDVELVLRFFANRQRMVHYRDNIRGYLDDYVQAANLYSPETISTLRELYVSTIGLAWELFGEFAFRRPRNGRWGNVPNFSIYDALTNVLSRLTSERDLLLARKAEVVAGLEDFYAENAAKFNLRGQTRADVMDREILLENYLRSFL